MVEKLGLVQGSIKMFQNPEHYVQVQSLLLLALVLLKLLDQQKQLNQRLNLLNILNLLTYHLLTSQPRVSNKTGRYA